MSKIALLIGVSEYQSGLNPLPAAVQDVESVRRVLVNPEMGAFADADVTVLKNPQPDDIRYAIYELFSNRQKDDLLLFYFSGHGIKDDRGNLYFATRDTRKENGKLVKPSAIAARTLHENINDSRSQRQVIVLDCCFSGAIAQGMTVKDDSSINIEEQLGGRGRAILTSSTSTQYSFEQQGSELSIYTRYLVEGVNTGVADKDRDGWISIDELHDYAKSKVQETSPAMTPEFYPVKEGHKILLAKSPKDDPKLLYRQEVERRAQESQGNFSIFASRILEGKRQELNISPEEANIIKEEVLQPYREYERKRYEYEQALIEAVEKHYPFSEVIQREIKEYQQYLALRDKDIAAIEQRVLKTKQPKEQEYSTNPTFVLPFSDEESRVILIKRTPLWAYASWSLSSLDRRKVEWNGGSTLVLRLYDVTGIDLSHESARLVQQYECEHTSVTNHRYVAIPVNNRNYIAEVGYLTPDKDWQLFARSQVITLSDLEQEFWFTVDTELIIHGSTKPGTTVKLGDHHIRVKVDGTFHLRIPFSEPGVSFLLEAYDKDSEQTKIIYQRFINEFPSESDNLQL